MLALFLSGYMVADSRTLVRRLVRLLPAPWDERLHNQMEKSGYGWHLHPWSPDCVDHFGRCHLLGITGIGVSGVLLRLRGDRRCHKLDSLLRSFFRCHTRPSRGDRSGGWIVLWVFILYVVVQNLETYILDPLLVGTAVGVHPLYQLLAVLGGVQVLALLERSSSPPGLQGFLSD